LSLKDQGREFKKKLISEIAYRLFSSQPFESITVEKIAREAGCGKGTIYLYFENKDHILTCLISQGLDKLCSDMEVKCLHNPDLASSINNYVVLQYHFFRDYNQILSSWGRRHLQNHICETWMHDIRQKLASKLEMAATVFERGIKENTLVQVDSHELAMLLENIFQNATFPFLVDKQMNRDPEGVLSLMKIILTHGIMLNKASPEV